MGNSKRFADKVAIITGSSSGIGLATAEAFAREGAKVIICARNQERLIEAANLIESEGGKVGYRALDLADLDAFVELIQQTAEAEGRLDILVNNAAVTRHKTIPAMSLDNWRKNFSVTVDATFAGTQAAMAINGRAGNWRSDCQCIIILRVKGSHRSFGLFGCQSCG